MADIYFLSVGCGDATIIRSECCQILIDCHNIQDHLHLLKTKIIDGVFVTHHHSDHYSGLAHLLERGYKIKHLIFSPYERRQNDNSLSLEEWREFNSLKEKFVEKGTKAYKPFRQEAFDKSYWEIDKFSFSILGPHRDIATSPTRECHDASLVIWLKAGSHRLCFAGDASDKNLKEIAQTTKGIANCILHASHHGSINGAELDFIKKSSPIETIISTKSGVYENVPHPTALARYKAGTKGEIHRTDIKKSLTLKI